jgi:hypothetical protein
MSGRLRHELVLLLLFAVLLWSAIITRPLGAAPLPATDWPNVNGDKGGTRYSPLTQIHRGNVGSLRFAWTYRTGDGGTGSGSTIECTPIVAEGVMFVTSCSPRPKVIALDAATGRERWTFNPYHNDGGNNGGQGSPRKSYPIASGGVNRGSPTGLMAGPAGPGACCTERRTGACFRWTRARVGRTPLLAIGAWWTCGQGWIATFPAYSMV